MKKINLSLISLLLSLTISIAQADFFNKKDLTAAIGLQSDSLLHKRGIVTYGSYQVFPIFSITLFNPDLSLAGSAIYYKYRLLGKKIILRTRLNIGSTPDRPLYYTDEEEDERVRRDETSELDFFLEYQNEDNYYVRFQSSTDVAENNGQYFELYGHIPLYNFSKGKRSESLIQLGAFVSVGYGDLKHNEYLYGVDASDWSINNAEYGFSISSPKALEMFWPTLKFSRFQILNDDNRSASFVKEKDGWNIELLVAKRVW